MYRINTPRGRVTAVATAICLAVNVLGAQTKIVAPSNKYDVAEDVQLGIDASREVEQQLPLLRDAQVTAYVERLGSRLVQEIPAEFRHPEFDYSFKVVNVREINAFALPGGPMYVNRGMLESARTEGEAASVIAHEISHVALRHGTAQASKATKYQIGALAGAILGAIVGGTAGTAISQGTQFGLGTAFMRFSREYEQQADILGSHIMASANYDPREMANMFRTIEKESGSGGPQWLSDHPNPGNRAEYITREAEMLGAVNAQADSREFSRLQSRLREMPRAPSTEEATRNGAGRTRPSNGNAGTLGRVDPPSSRVRTYDEGGVFRVSVPMNWRELPDGNSVTFAPDGAYGTLDGNSVFTHGLQLGIERYEDHDLQVATDELIDSLAVSNPRLSRPQRYEPISVANRRGLHTILTNVSDATGQTERVEVFTAMLADGSLFYALGIAPSEEFSTYQGAFRRAVSSIQISNRL